MSDRGLSHGLIIALYGGLTHRGNYTELCGLWQRQGLFQGHQLGRQSYPLWNPRLGTPTYFMNENAVSVP